MNWPTDLPLGQSGPIQFVELDHRVDFGPCCCWNKFLPPWPLVLQTVVAVYGFGSKAKIKTAAIAADAGG